MSGIAGLLAARLDRFHAWDMEASFLNPRRYRQGKAKAGLLSSTRNHWRTTRFVTKLGSGDFLHNGVRKSLWHSPSRDIAMASGSFLSSDLVGEGAMRVLFSYSKDRLVKLVRTAGELGPDGLNDYVSLLRIGTLLEETLCTGAMAKRARDESDGGVRYSDDDTENRSEITTICPGKRRRMFLAGSGHLPGMERSERARYFSDAFGKVTPTQGEAVASAKYATRLKKSIITERLSGNAAFSSFESGINRGILYNSVLQSRPKKEQFDLGDDSDGDVFIDEDWRLELNDRLLIEYLDTFALEKLYMNMWNNFAMTEVYIHSDRRVMEAVVCFARRYGAVIDQLNMGVIFIRHLGELSNLGLIDASGIFDAVCAMRDAKNAVASNSENIERILGRYPFYNRLLHSKAVETSCSKNSPSLYMWAS